MSVLRSMGAAWARFRSGAGTARRVLLLSTAAAAVGAVAAPREAAAQIPVTCTSCPTEISEMLRHGKSLAEWANQLRELQAIHGQAQATYWALTNIRDLGTAVQALQMAGISNPLPVNAHALQALMGGYGGPQGMLNNVGSLFTTNSSNLLVYQCDVPGFVCDSMRRWRDGAAGTQAASMQLYQSSADRAPQITALQAQIASARTPAVREALTAQLTAANAQTSNQLVQAIAVQTFGQQQAGMRDQQAAERMQQSIDAVIQDARSRGITP